MESVTELRRMCGVGDVVAGPGYRQTAFNARPGHKEIREFHSDANGWHTRHRLDDFQSNLYQEPEKMLMFAILVDAICALTSCPLRRERREIGNGLEARHWLCSNRQDWPFAYRNVCEVLGFNPDYSAPRASGPEPIPRPDDRRGETQVSRLEKPILAGTKVCCETPYR